MKKKIATIFAVVVFAAVALATAFGIYVKENIASGDDHTRASKANQLLNNRLLSEFSTFQCSGLESRYEAKKGAVYFHVHNWRDTCKESEIRNLAETVAREAYGEAKIAIHVKLHAAATN